MFITGPEGNAPALLFVAVMTVVDGGQMIHHKRCLNFSWECVVDGSCVNSPLTGGEHLTCLSECDLISYTHTNSRP